MSSPKDAQNACYFYNRLEDNAVRFISYHFEPRADITENFQDASDALHKILNIT